MSVEGDGRSKRGRGRLPSWRGVGGAKNIPVSVGEWVLCIP